MTKSQPLRSFKQATSQGANVIVFPETWLPGYPVWLDCAPNAALWDHPPAKALYRLLVENSVTIPGKHLEALPGSDNELLLRGGSAIIAPDSSFVADPVFDESCIVYAETEPERVINGHLVLDTLGHYARPDVFRLAVNDQPQSNVAFRGRQETTSSKEGTLP